MCREDHCVRRILLSLSLPKGEDCVVTIAVPNVPACTLDPQAGCLSS